MATFFVIKGRLSHSIIAQICVAYLLTFDQSDSFQTPVTRTGVFPLHLYAAEYTKVHLSFVKSNTCPPLQQLLLDLFVPAPGRPCALISWV